MFRMNQQGCEFLLRPLAIFRDAVIYSPLICLALALRFIHYHLITSQMSDPNPPVLMVKLDSIKAQQFAKLCSECNSLFEHWDDEVYTTAELRQMFGQSGDKFSDRTARFRLFPRDRDLLAWIDSSSTSCSFCRCLRRHLAESGDDWARESPQGCKASISCLGDLVFSKWCKDKESFHNYFPPVETLETCK
jgi:hypothetical protein